MELSDFKNFNDIYENPQTITDCNLASSEINLLKFKVDGDELTAFNRKISVPKIISEVYNGKDILLGFYSSSLVEGDGGMKVEILDTIICDDGIKCISETNGQQFFFNLKSTLKEGDKSVKLSLSDKYFLFDLNGKRIL